MIAYSDRISVRHRVNEKGYEPSWKCKSFRGGIPIIHDFCTWEALIRSSARQIHSYKAGLSFFERVQLQLLHGRGERKRQTAEFENGIKLILGKASLKQKMQSSVGRPPQLTQDIVERDERWNWPNTVIEFQRLTVQRHRIWGGEEAPSYNNTPTETTERQAWYLSPTSTLSMYGLSAASEVIPWLAPAE